MPTHDSYARVTPFELLLPSEEFAEERFPLIREEAEGRGHDLADPDGFPLLSEVGRILREIRGEDDHPRLIQERGALLFHAFHFWQEASPLFL
ncbi:hypothetical protein ACFL0I_04835, partial [Gemmatimonadota bacterium]